MKIRENKKAWLLSSTLVLAVFILAGCGTKQKTYSFNESSAGSTDRKLLSSTEETNEINQQNMNVPNEINLALAEQYSGVVIVTNLGEIEVEFYEENPITAANFLTLAQGGFYDNTIFHRVIKDFMIQGGDPNSKNADRATHGMGGPGYSFADEINNRPLVKGSLAMANSGPSTNGSQFFIVTAESTPWLDGKHTNFGEVVSGMEIVDKIEALQTDERDNPVQSVKIERVELKEKK